MSDRMTMSDKRRLAETFATGNNPVQSVTSAGNNRAVITLRDGTKMYTLHRTAVVTRLPGDGCPFVLNNGGWNTLTTRAAMDEGLALLVTPGLPPGSHMGVSSGASRRKRDGGPCEWVLRVGLDYGKGDHGGYVWQEFPQDDDRASFNLRDFVK